ncbi:glutaredoxin [Kineosporiaceae bacterium SCSIO 59966]|nr:glutaredoxin [Kineosporiaceae bacterium SCSIO 59966]
MTGSPIHVTVVHAPACHLCEDAEAELSRLAGSYPLVIERVDIRSQRGQDLTRRHRSPMSPLVLVDGTFFSFGRLPRKKLVRLLEQRHSVAAQAG